MTMRRDVTFTSGSDVCAAWLYSPHDDAAPLVVMTHGLTGTRRDRLGAFAERFSAAGVAALVFDHRGFGDSAGEPDHVDPALQLEDWRAAIALARTLAGVDPERIATFGSSLGGGNAAAAGTTGSRPRSAGSPSSTARPGRTAPSLASRPRWGRRAPRGEVRTYPGVAHFDIYDGPEHEAVVADELDFLRRHLRPSAQATPGPQLTPDAESAVTRAPRCGRSSGGTTSTRRRDTA